MSKQKKVVLRYSVKGILKTFLPLLIVALAICGYYVFENYTGAKRWKEVKRALEADGIITDRSIFQTPMPSSAENFAAHPLISSCYEYSTDANGNIFYDRPDEHDRFTAMEVEGLSAIYPPAKWTTGTPFQFDRIIENIEYTGQLIVPEEGSDTARFLGVFTPYKEELAALEKAAKLPHAQMPFAPPEGNPYLASTPYLNEFLNHGKFQEVRAVALLEECRPDEAVASLRIMMQIARTAGSHPSMSGVEIEDILNRNCAEVVMMGIEQQIWSDSHLFEIQEIISRQSIFDHAQRGFNSKLVSAGIFADDLKKSCSLSDFQGHGSSNPIWIAAPILPSGIWDHNKGCGSEQISVEIQLLRQGQFDNSYSPAIRPLYYPRRMLAEVMLPGLNRYTKSIFEAETLRELTILSCAIERYRLNFGKLPDELNLLIPKYISKIPPDRFDKSSTAIKYILDRENTTYIVYSVGINGTDEMGKAAGTHRRDKYNGDLSWGIPCPWPVHKK